MVSYKIIKSKKIYEEVADQLLNMISTGVLKPGDKLDSVQKLSEKFEVGRSAIREALSALRAMGLVEMKQGEGTFIKYYNPQSFSQSLTNLLLMEKKDLEDLLDVRKILELGAVESAALKRNEEDLNAIKAVLNNMKVSTMESSDIGEKADIDFHIAIARAAHNPLLENLMLSVSEAISKSMKETRRIWIFSKTTTLEKLFEQHQNIYEAIKRKDVEESKTLMEYHLNSVQKTLLTYMHE